MVSTHFLQKAESIKSSTLLKQSRYVIIMIKIWLKFGSTAIGIRTNEGVVLGVEKKLPSKLMEATKTEKLVEVRIINQIFNCVNIDRQTLWLRYEWNCGRRENLGRSCSC